MSVKNRQKQLLTKQRLGHYIAIFIVLKNIDTVNLHPHVLLMLDNWLQQSKGRPVTDRSRYSDAEIETLKFLSELKISDIHPTIEHVAHESPLQVSEKLILKNHVFCIPVIDGNVRYFRSPYGSDILSLHKLAQTK